MCSKLLLITEVLILISIALIIWYYDFDGIQVILIICIVGVSIVITGYFAIKNRNGKTGERPVTNIEASCESMLASEVAIEANPRHRLHNSSTLSDESVVLRQSYFSPQIVSAVIENEDKPRDSVISNNEVPPTYEEAQQLPKL